MELVSNVTATVKQYYVTYEELATKLGIKEKITGVVEVTNDGGNSMTGVLFSTETVLEV